MAKKYNPYILAGTAATAIGTGLSNIAESSSKNNTDNMFLQEAISGNQWSDIFNNASILRDARDSIQDQVPDFSEVLNNQNLFNSWDSNNIQQGLQEPTPGQVAGNIGGAFLADAGKGAAIGASLGNVIPGLGTVIGGTIGAIGGAVSGLSRGIVSSINNSKNTALLNQDINQANKKMIKGFYNQADTNTEAQIRNNMRNIFAEGGNISGLNGIQKIETGGSHEQNPYGGQTVGYAKDGIPNKVEEGEIIYDGYVYSARLKSPKSLLEKYNLPTKYSGKAFASIAEKLQKESEERPNDPISISTLKDLMGRLRDAQEEYRVKLNERKLAKAFDSLPDDAKAQVVNQAMQSTIPTQNNLGMSQLTNQLQTTLQNEAAPIQEPSLNDKQMMSKGGHLFNDGGNPDDPPANWAYVPYSPLLINQDINPTIPTTVSKVQPWDNIYSIGSTAYSSLFPQDFGWEDYWNIPHYDSTGTTPYDYYHTYVAPSLGKSYNYFKNQDELTQLHQKYISKYFNQRDGKRYTDAQIKKLYLKDYSDLESYIKYLRDTNDPAARYYGSILYDQFGQNDTLGESPDYLKWAKETYPDNPKKWDGKIGIAHAPELRYGLSSQTTPTPLAVTPPDAATQSTPADRYWYWNEDGNKISITPDTIPTGYTLDEDLTETGPDENGVLGTDYYYVPSKETTIKPPIDDIDNTSDNYTDVLRYAPAVGAGLGAIAAALQGPDYSYSNQLRNIASEFNPVAAQTIGGWRRYTPHDINLANNEAMAQLAAANRSNVASGNRASQAAGLTALQNAFAQEGSTRNLAWQQANEANRLATDQYNLGIDQINLNTTQQYDNLNQQIKERRLGMLASAAKAQDDSNTAWANNVSATTTNLFNQLGNIGKDNWNYNQRNAILKEFGMEGLAKILGLTI